MEKLKKFCIHNRNYIVICILVLLMGVVTVYTSRPGENYGMEFTDRVYETSKNPIRIKVTYKDQTILETDLSFKWTSVPASYQEAGAAEYGIALNSGAPLSMADTVTINNKGDAYDYVQSDLTIELPETYQNQQYYIKSVSCSSYTYDGAYASMTYDAAVGKENLLRSEISGFLTISVPQAGLKTYERKYPKRESVTIELEQYALSAKPVMESADGKHYYTAEVVKPATTLANGTIKYTCVECKEQYTETIPRIKSVVLKQEEVELKGDAAENEFVVSDAEGNLIDPEYYDVSFKDNTEIGTAQATITFKDRYSGTQTQDYRVILRKDKNINILMIGQSMTYSSTHPEYMKHFSGMLSDAGYENIKITVCAGGSSVVGPRGLIDMTDKKQKYYKDIYAKITSISFDYIIFQDLQYNQYQSMSTSSRYYRGVGRLMNWILKDSKSKNKNARVIVRATWGNKSQLKSKTTTDTMYNNAVYIKAAYGLYKISKEGQAFYYAYKEAKTKVTDLWREDGHHCSDTGGFLAAMTTYTMLTGSDPSIAEYTGGLRSTVAANLKTIAWNVQMAQTSEK